MTNRYLWQSVRYICGFKFNAGNTVSIFKQLVGRDNNPLRRRAHPGDTSADAVESISIIPLTH